MARTLPYAAVDVRWEALQLRAFRQLPQNTHTDTFAHFLFGRLLAEDLHVSCSPVLPPDVERLHGVRLQGLCVLQIVDVANVGASVAHRKEDVRGRTRTLKICFTDGHQLVFGFEFRWLPTFSTSLLHGTKVALVDVDISHGLLRLTPENCRLLGLSGNELLEQTRKSVQGATETPTGAGAGVYSAALMTSQFSAGPTSPQERLQKPGGGSRPPVVPFPPTASVQSGAPVRLPPPQASPHGHTGQWSAHTPANRPVSAASTSGSVVTPLVFVDVISSGEDCDSDDTDPTVQHLFYSPHTPRELETSTRSASSRPKKRPREPAAAAGGVGEASRRTVQATPNSSSTSAAVGPVRRPEASDGSNSTLSKARVPPPASPPEAADELLGFALLDATNRSNGTRVHSNPSDPFQYFSARVPALSAANNRVLDDVVRIRACIKSVAGFQFNTGTYALKVLIEDCTETREVSVDAAFVETLMGVPCVEFLRAMQHTPPVAHQWAACMQLALMTLEGVMEFRMNPNGTFTLLACRDVSGSDARALVQRVKRSLQR